MRKLIPAILSAVLISTPLTSLAFGQNDIPMDIAERGMALVVSPEGCVVNVTTGTITAIALSDRSSFVYSQVQNSVYIKPIQRQQFEGVVSMHDGSTTLRIWVGNKILRFKVRYASSGSKDLNIVEKTSFVSLPKQQKQAYLPPLTVLSAPVPKKKTLSLPPAPAESSNHLQTSTYTSEAFPLLKPVAVITPEKQSSFKDIKIDEPEKPKIIKEKTRNKSKRNKSKKSLVTVVPEASAISVSKPTAIALVAPSQIISLTPQNLSVSLLKGLNAARIHKKVAYQSRTWNQVQSVIIGLRRGIALDIAIARSGAKKAIVYQFLKMGGVRV
jgi:hypothetical protein